MTFSCLRESPHLKRLRASWLGTIWGHGSISGALAIAQMGGNPLCMSTERGMFCSLFLRSRKDACQCMHVHCLSYAAAV